MEDSSPQLHSAPSLLHILPLMTTRLATRSTTQSIMSALTADCKHLRPRRFAPLDPDVASDAPPLKGVVFDVDGTLW